MAGLLGFVTIGLSWAQSPSSCRIEPFAAARGETATVKMHVINDGTPCVLSPRVGAGRAESISIIEQPTNGHLELAQGAVRYIPKPHFSGPDVFVVAWFGHGASVGGYGLGANFRTRVEADVRVAGAFDGRWQGEGKPTPACADTAAVTFEVRDGEFRDFLFTGPREKTTDVRGRITDSGSADIEYGPSGLKGNLQFQGNLFVGQMDSLCGMREVSGQRVR